MTDLVYIAQDNTGTGRRYPIIYRSSPGAVQCFCRLTHQPGETHTPQACAGPTDRIALAVRARYGKENM